MTSKNISNPPRVFYNNHLALDICAVVYDILRVEEIQTALAFLPRVGARPSCKASLSLVARNTEAGRAKAYVHGTALCAGLKKLGSCHMEYITSRKKIRSLLHPVDDESTRVMAVPSHCLSVNSYK